MHKLITRTLWCLMYVIFMMPLETISCSWMIPASLMRHALMMFLKTKYPREWYAYSPNLNPLEHVWDTTGRRMTERNLPPLSIKNIKHFVVVLKRVWYNLFQNIVDDLLKQPMLHMYFNKRWAHTLLKFCKKL